MAEAGIRRVSGDVEVDKGRIVDTWGGLEATVTPIGLEADGSAGISRGTALVAKVVEGGGGWRLWRAAGGVRGVAVCGLPSARAMACCAACWAMACKWAGYAVTVPSVRVVTVGDKAGMRGITDVTEVDAEGVAVVVTMGAEVVAGTVEGLLLVGCPLCSSTRLVRKRCSRSAFRPA